MTVSEHFGGWSMRLGGRLLAILLLAVAPVSAAAEIQRLSLEDAMKELAAARPPDPDKGFSVPFDGFLSKIPDIARVVLPRPGPRNIKAVFRVKPPGQKPHLPFTVRMKLIDDRTYGVAWRSKGGFRSWLRNRVPYLVQGDVVLEEIVGLQPAGVSFLLAVADVAEELLAAKDPEPVPEGGLTHRAVEQILGTSVRDAGFIDLDGGNRRFADFGQRMLLLNIWATWCAPCIAEMPALEALQDRYRDRGLTVVNLSDERARVLRRWLSKNPPTMLHGRVDGFEFLLGDPPLAGVKRNLGVRPVYVVVDREGIVRDIRVGAPKVVLLGSKAVDEKSEHHAAAWVKPYLVPR